MSSESDILDSIFASVMPQTPEGSIPTIPEDCFFCRFKIELELQKPGAFAIIYECLKNIVLKIIGYPIIKFAELVTLATDIVEAINDAIQGSLEKINALIEKIMAVYNFFMNFLTKTKDWIIQNCLEFYENFIIPIGSIDISLTPIDLSEIGISLPNIELSFPLPENKKYRELDINDPLRNFDNSSIKRFITAFIEAPINFIMSYIIKFMKIVIGIINAINEFLQTLNPSIIYEWIAQLVEFFVELAAPILKIITNFVESLAKIINVAMEEIQEFINKCMEYVMYILGLIPNLSFSFIDLPAWMKTIINLILCLVKLVISVVTGIFSITSIAS